MMVEDQEKKVDNLEGKLIVIDGSDGSGKTWQADLLVARFEKEGYKVNTISFPRYGNPAAEDVARYLRGEFGPKEGIPPKKVAGFYAFDRADAAPEIFADLKSGIHKVSNRYISANVGHQSIRLPTWEERDEFVDWLFDYEFNQMGIPRPAATIICHVPYEVAAGNIMKKDSSRQDRSYLHGAKMDIHEKDKAHLMNAIEAYQRYATRLDGWHLVDCAKDGEMRDAKEIHEDIWKIVEPILRRD
jgi:dTMP kinase